jgi:hypothetical protein
MQVNPQVLKTIITDFTNLLADTERKRHLLTPQEMLVTIKEGLNKGIEELMDLWLTDDIARMEDTASVPAREEVDYQSYLTGQLIAQKYQRFSCGPVILWSKSENEARAWIQANRTALADEPITRTEYTKKLDSDFLVRQVETTETTISSIDTFLASL